MKSDLEFVAENYKINLKELFEKSEEIVELAYTSHSQHSSVHRIS